MKADNGTFGIHMLRNQSKTAYSWLPFFNFYYVTLVPFSSASKIFSLFLIQVEEKFLSTPYLAATSLLLIPVYIFLVLGIFYAVFCECIYVFLHFKRQIGVFTNKQ